MTEQEKQWIKAWRSAGPELERIRNDELRVLSDDEGTRQATYLGVFPLRPPSPNSGLNEFQTYMARWRKKLAAPTK